MTVESMGFRTRWNGWCRVLERFIFKWKQFCRSWFSSVGRRLATG